MGVNFDIKVRHQGRVLAVGLALGMLAFFIYLRFTSQSVVGHKVIIDYSAYTEGQNNNNQASYESRADVFSEKSKYQNSEGSHLSNKPHENGNNPFTKKNDLCEDEDPICRDVTIVMSYKDVFGTTKECMEAIYAFTPNVPIIYIMSEPMPPLVRSFLEEEAKRNKFLTLFDTGYFFANPYALRNMIIPYIETKYIMYVFNDVIPLNDQWLTAMYEDAEANPHIDVQQPFIYEPVQTDDGKFVADEFRGHGYWKNLYFFSLGEDQPLREQHKYDSSYKEKKPEDMELEKIPFHIEDHLFLVRTSSVQENSFMDPGGCYGKEFLDMALNAKYLGISLYHNPRSVVQYLQPGQAPNLYDVKNFAVRRSEATCYGSIEYIRRKWGIELPWDHYDSYFLAKNYKNYVNFDDESIPETMLMQSEMTANMLTIFGYTNYDVSFDIIEDEKDTDLLKDMSMGDMYSALLDHADNSMAIQITASWAPKALQYDLTGVDVEDRQMKLRSGDLFSIRSAEKAKKKKKDVSFNQFVVLKVSGITAADDNEFKVLKRDATMITKQDSSENTYEAWYYAVVELPSKQATIELSDLGKNKSAKFAGLSQAPTAFEFHFCFRDSDLKNNCEITVNLDDDYKIWWWQVKHLNVESMKDLFQ